MTDFEHEHDGHPTPAPTIHDHVAASRDDWEHVRLLLTLLHVEMCQNWPTTLAAQLADRALLTATVNTGREVSAGDSW